MKAILKFIPLLLLYFFYVLLTSESRPFGDEIRYLGYAENLLKGFYTAADNPNLINGPGYPLFLAFFVALDLPLIVPKLGNALLFFGAVCFLYGALRFYVPSRQATFFAYALGLYWPVIIYLNATVTEAPAMFLLCGFMYFMIKLQREEKRRPAHMIAAGLMVGYLALTRDIFSYVILCGLVLAVAAYVLFRRAEAVRWAATLGIGFLVVVPYLYHTWSLTGRYLYFSSNGGEQLYWMSSALPGEYGAFFSIDSLYERRSAELVRPEHIPFVDSIFHLPYVERNDALVAEAKAKIWGNPAGYIKNVIANALRLVSDGPTSYSPQGWYVYKYLFTHLLYLIPLLLSLYPAWRFRKSIPLEILALCLFMAIYVGGSLLVTALARYFVMVIPVILLWLAFFFTHTIRLSFENRWTGTAA